MHTRQISHIWVLAATLIVSAFVADSLTNSWLMPNCHFTHHSSSVSGLFHACLPEVGTRMNKTPSIFLYRPWFMALQRSRHRSSPFVILVGVVLGCMVHSIVPRLCFQQFTRLSTTVQSATRILHHYISISTIPFRINSSSTTNMASELTLQSTITLSSGYKIPLLGFGVFQNSDATPAVLEAFKVGYRHIDTAQYYRNEAQVGEAVHKSGLNRSDVFITTKIMSNNHGYHSTQQGIADSLAKMKLDYIDLFLIHDPLSGTQRRLETYQALLEAKAVGKINSVGVSNYGIKHLEEIRTAGFELPSVNQIELHPFNQQTDIVKYCQQYNIVVQAYCPLVHGKMDHPVILGLAAKYKRGPAQILVRWSMQKGFIPLPKSERPSRIQSNADVYGFELDVNDIRKLDSLNRGKAGSVSWNPVDAP